jgi:hypothetical protein
LKWKLPQTDVITRNFNHCPHIKSRINIFLKLKYSQLSIIRANGGDGSHG